MNKVASKSLIVASLLMAGAVLGPVMIAAGGAAIAANSVDSPMYKRNEADLLVRAYRERLRVGYLFMSVIMPENGKECGYDPDIIFPESSEQLATSARERKYTEYAGYWVLDRWRNQTADDEWLGAVTQKIDDDMSDFEAGFLRRCIEATLFSSACMKRVEPYGDRVVRFEHNRPAWPPRGFGIEDQIVCTYVDGIAARRGMKVPVSRN